MGRRSDLAAWGSSAWTFMHVASWTYPDFPSEEDRKNMFRFMHGLARVIPCGRCRQDWAHYLDVHLPSEECAHLDSRTTFTHFLVEGHNYVNRKLGKRAYTYAEARFLYDANYTDVDSSTFYVQTFVAVLLVSIILFAAYSRFSSARETPRARER